MLYNAVETYRKPEKIAAADSNIEYEISAVAVGG